MLKNSQTNFFENRKNFGL